jgi:O-succinylbenzoic acid--CoA ligase
MSYRHSSLLVNSREISMAAILSASVNPQSEFECETFAFIKSWLNHTTAFTLTTSGSTGTPKEISLTRDQLITNATRTISKLKLSEKNTALVCLDTKYIAGKMMLVRALEANMPIVAVEPSSNPLKNISQQPDFGAFVPLQLDEIFRHEESIKKLNRFKSIIIGGASASTPLLEKVKTLSCDAYATYGMTETVSHIALQKLNGSDAQDYFEAFPDVKIKTDERDCLVIELPDFSEPIITNDIVKIIHPGGFKIFGRYDNIINSGGVKLMPETIEKKIEPILKQPFFVSGIQDDRLGQKLVLIVEGYEQPGLLTALKLALPTYEIPREIFYLDQFVRTETQKINRPKTLEKAQKSKP